MAAFVARIETEVHLPARVASMEPGMEPNKAHIQSLSLKSLQDIQNAEEDRMITERVAYLKECAARNRAMQKANTDPRSMTAEERHEFDTLYALYEQYFMDEKDTAVLEIIACDKEVMACGQAEEKLQKLLKKQEEILSKRENGRPSLMHKDFSLGSVSTAALTTALTGTNSSSGTSGGVSDEITSSYDSSSSGDEKGKRRKEFVGGSKYGTKHSLVVIERDNSGTPPTELLSLDEISTPEENALKKLMEQGDEQFNDAMDTSSPMIFLADPNGSRPMDVVGECENVIMTAAVESANPPQNQDVMFNRIERTSLHADRELALLLEDDNKKMMSEQFYRKVFEEVATKMTKDIQAHFGFDFGPDENKLDTFLVEPKLKSKYLPAY